MGHFSEFHFMTSTSSSSKPTTPTQITPTSPSNSSIDRNSSDGSISDASRQTHTYGSFNAEIMSGDLSPSGSANLYEAYNQDFDMDAALDVASGQQQAGELAQEHNDSDSIYSENSHVLTDDSIAPEDILDIQPMKTLKKSEQFSNSCTFLISALGSCVGSGNVWRFSRIVALVGGKKGAGAFLMVWAMFLATWSIPIIIAEYAMGRATRKTLVGTFWKLGGRYMGWMGVIMVLVNLMICCYYSVICGWCFYYLIRCIFWPLPTEVGEATEVFNHFTEESYFPLLTHGIAILLAAVSMIGGMKSIEKVNMVLVPALLVILFACFIRTLFLPGAFAGIAYMFYPDMSILLSPLTWVEALSQISFDTGAGWGLLTSYANGLSDKANVVKMGSITPCGNNMVSLVSAMTVFGTTFAMLGSTMSDEEVLKTMRDSGIAGTGMTFIYFPVLFAQMWGGKVIAIFFFLALSFAALSSLISISNLPTKQLVDFGFPRIIALLLVVSVTFAVGSGSALSVSVLTNQDAVWGSSLIFMGLFMSFLVIKYGPKRFRTQFINKSAGFLWRQTRLYDFVICVMVPIQALILMGWWIVKSIMDQPKTFWNPILVDSLGTSLAQWSLVLIVSIAANVLVLCCICIHRRLTRMPDTTAGKKRKVVEIEHDEERSSFEENRMPDHDQI